MQSQNNVSLISVTVKNTAGNKMRRKSDRKICDENVV